MTLTVTLVIAAACGLINIWLAARASMVRISDKVDMGDGGNMRLIARMRAHANFTEYAPFVLVLMALIELSGAGSTWLWVAGIAFVLGRLAHAFGMGMPAPNPLRMGGIAATLILLLALSVWALAIGYGAALTRAPAAKTVLLR